MSILNKLTIKHLTMNKKRTIVTIIGVILSTALMVGIGLLFSSVQDNSVKMTIYENGPQHVILQGVHSDKLDILKKNVKVKKVGYTKSLGFGNLIEQDSAKAFYQVLASSKDLLNTLKLKEGRLPKKSNEIVITEDMNHGDETYQIGDDWTVTIGEYEEYTGDYKDDDYVTWLNENHVINPITKTYKIVGIIETSYTENYANNAYHVFTLDEPMQEVKTMDAYIIYKNPKDAYTVSKILAQNSLMEKTIYNEDEAYEGIVYNTSLLSLSGASKYSNFTNSMTNIILIILSLVSIGCIVVIYNSFAISVMERKKQFGLFSSIGSTKSQLRKTVFFEAFLVGIIGIPLGIIGALVGIGVVIYIVNMLLPSAFTVPLALSIYPLFIWIPILFMIAVIVVSAYLPARKASRITPIEAIRQNDDIKIKGKQIKTNGFIRKLFGVEGELALKNIKRNKRKYRITIVSLFISIVLFISFSGILYYGFYSAMEYTDYPEYDIALRLSDRDPDKIEPVMNQIVKHEQVEQYIVMEREIFLTTDLTSDNYNAALFKKLESSLPPNQQINVSLYGLDDKNYQQFKQKIGLKEDRPIVINRYKGTYYTQTERKSIDMKKFSTLPDSIDLCIYDYEKSTEGTELLCNQKISNLYMTDQYPFGFDTYLNGPSSDVMIILSQSMLDAYHAVERKQEAGYGELRHDKDILIKTSKYDKLEETIKELEEKILIEGFMYSNVKEEMRLMSNIILVVKILLYGFIALVTLIGVTSVFNTINTSINLRRKEFAMLRSMGLTPKGFNKILAFESIFFGLKSLLYGLPVSIGVVYLLYLSFGNMVQQKFVLPWQSIGIAVLGVFIIVYITMKYASNKIKKENILDAIREENI